MTSLEFTDDYYNHHWSKIEPLSPQEEDRIRKTISLIPEDCHSILDIGCGDGRITNRLVSGYSRVVGLDQSKEALRHVKSQKMLGSIESLPFPDRSFDLVLSSEVLEHLPFKVYPKALSEIERVAAKYIIVTVPNNEDIKRSLVTCPHCSCAFHPWMHLRSFNIKRMQELFSQFSLETFKLCQPLAKEYPGFLIKIAKLLRLIPSNFSPTALCPQCGYTPLSSHETGSSLSSDVRNSFLVQLIRPLARWLIPTRKTGGWLMVLYQKGQEELYGGHKNE